MDEEEVVTGAASDVRDGASQYLTFQVLGNRYAIDILEVKEILEAPQMTRVPKAHASVSGVMNLRGNVVPVVDLAHRLNSQTLDAEQRRIILVVELLHEGETQTFGMLANEVNEIVEIDAEQIQAAPDFGAGIRREFIGRMASVGEDFVVLLDLQRVLDIDELAQRAAERRDSTEALDV